MCLRSFFFFLEELLGAFGGFGAGVFFQLAEDLHLGLGFAGFSSGAQSLREKEMNVGLGGVGFLGGLQIRDGFFIAIEAHQGAAAIEAGLGKVRTNRERLFDLSESSRGILALFQSDVAKLPLRRAVNNP